LTGPSSARNTGAEPLPREHPGVRSRAAPTENGHKARKHGGTIWEVRRDKYHVEVVFGDAARGPYLPGKDNVRVEVVDLQTLTAHAGAGGDLKVEKFTLKATPRPDDMVGNTPEFVGTLPQRPSGKRVDVTVPAIWIGRQH
jgi:hypothetical protein